MAGAWRPIRRPHQGSNLDRKWQTRSRRQACHTRACSRMVGFSSPPRCNRFASVRQDTRSQRVEARSLVNRLHYVAVEIPRRTTRSQQSLTRRLLTVWSKCANCRNRGSPRRASSNGRAGQTWQARRFDALSGQCGTAKRSSGPTRTRGRYRPSYLSGSLLGEKDSLSDRNNFPPLARAKTLRDCVSGLQPLVRSPVSWDHHENGLKVKPMTGAVSERPTQGVIPGEATEEAQLRREILAAALEELRI
jgi:hypothetical protein